MSKPTRICGVLGCTDDAVAQVTTENGQYVVCEAHIHADPEEVDRFDDE